jgi:hypothetical protein
MVRIFADNELRTVEFGKTGPEIVTEIISFKNVKPYGHTRLRDGIWEAVSMFQPNREGDTIVVVSDGGDNQSKVSMQRLREAMWSRGIRVMFVQFADRYFPSQFQDRDDADTAWLSESSGGFLSRIEDPQVLPKAAQEIAFEIENISCSAYHTPNATRETGLTAFGGGRSLWTEEEEH